MRSWKVTLNDGNSFVVTNHGHMYNKKQNTIFSGDRKTENESLWYEFLEVSQEKCANDLLDEYFIDVLNEDQLDAITVSVGNVGNPTSSFLSRLIRQGKFNYNYTVDDLLDFDDFVTEVRLNVQVYDIEKLSDSEKDEILELYRNLEEEFLDRFEDNATFEIYYSDGEVSRKIRYRDGKEIDRKNW